MKGSWAGAMGHTQFIPTTYEAYAVDFNKDGKRDIWGTVPDALASAANYIKASGWRSGETWGYEVKLPAKFDFSTSGRGRKKTIRQWEKLGVKRAGGKTFPRKSDVASLISPAGSQGPSFLILSNFNAIMRYNNSVAYALAIGHLADRLPGYVGGFHQSWPTGDKPLALSERTELQELLAEKGYAIGKVDGVMGIKTSRAIRSWQKSKGLPADGYPSLKLLEAIRNER
jgi:membrane-bound lytic murein transglycosylase B